MDELQGYQPKAGIEADPFDDEAGAGYAPLERWGDRRFCPVKDRWTELLMAELSR